MDVNRLRDDEKMQVKMRDVIELLCQSYEDRKEGDIAAFFNFLASSKEDAKEVIPYVMDSECADKP